MTVGAIGRYSGVNPYAFQRISYTPRQAATTAPVEPVAKSPAVENNSAAPAYAVPARPSSLPELRQGADPVEMAVRGRIQYLTPAEVDGLVRDRAASRSGVIGKEPPALPGMEEAKSPAEVMSEGECQTCAERKYQDGSNDPGVSFKTPGRIAPEVATSVVRGHEMEHVTRERAKAMREDREVVSQSVTLHTAICPECGKAYTSGGTTRTVTAANPQQPQQRVQPADPGFEAQA